MNNATNDPFIRAQAGAVGLFERLITGLHQEISALGKREKKRGRPSPDEADWIERRRASIEKEIEMCQRYRMEAMRDIGIPVSTIAVMVDRSMEDVEQAIRLAQYDRIPSYLESVIAAGEDIEPTKH